MEMSKSKYTIKVTRVVDIKSPSEELQLNLTIVFVQVH